MSDTSGVCSRCVTPLHVKSTGLRASEHRAKSLSVRLGVVFFCKKSGGAREDSGPPRAGVPGGGVRALAEWDRVTLRDGVWRHLRRQ